MSGTSPGSTAVSEANRWRALLARGLVGLFVNLIRVYRVALSPLLAGACRFQPSCSSYAEEAIRTHGPGWGVVLAAKRLLRCHPFGGSGYDAVPAPHGRPGRGQRPAVKSTRPSSPSGRWAGAPSRRNSLWWNWREHRARRGARLTRRVREEYRVYSDRNATMRAAQRPVSAEMHRRSNAARVSPQAVNSRWWNPRGPVLPVGAPPSRAWSAGPPPGELGLAPTGRTGDPGARPGSPTGG